MQFSLKGPITLFLSMLSTSIGNSFIHYLSGRYSCFQILFYKSFFSIILLCLCIPSWKNFYNNLNTTHLIPNLSRAIIGTTGVLLWIPAAQHIPLADSSTLSLTSSFFGLLLGYVFLKEKPYFYKNFALIMGFLGSYLIIQPLFKEQNIYYLLPLASAFCFGISGVFARFLILKDQEYMTSFYLFLTMFVCSLIFSDKLLPFSLMDFIFLIIIGFSYGISQLLYVRAYKYEEVSYLANFKFLRVPLHVLIAFSFFSEIPSIETLIGFIVIMSSLIILVYKKEQS